MNLMDFPSIVRRRVWLILAVAVLVTAAAGFALRPGKLAYESTVRLQLTTPQQEDIALLNQYRPADVRDTATLTRNNFMVVIESPEVAHRTVDGLQLEGDSALYDVEARLIRDTEFLDVTVHATTPALAVGIANAHVAEAIRRYGELRAKPATATRDVLSQALQNAEQAASVGDAQGTEQASEAYEMLLRKYAEATLVEQSAQHVSYIQVIDQAREAVHSMTTRKFGIMLGLAAFGGLGVGTILAFLMESSKKRARITVETPYGTEMYYDIEDEPIVTPATGRIALREPYALDDDEPSFRTAFIYPSAPRDAQEPRRARVQRILKVARPVLRTAERSVAPEQQESIGAALRTLRAIVHDNSRALAKGTAVDEVLRLLKANVDGVAELLSVADRQGIGRQLRNSTVGPDIEALVAEAIDDQDAISTLVERAASPVVGPARSSVRHGGRRGV